jgi:Arc/MetJ family transcription regulator
MRTTLILKDDLIKRAMEETGITEKTEVVHRGLEELLRTLAYQRLSSLGGYDRQAKAPSRRKQKK